MKTSPPRSGLVGWPTLIVLLGLSATYFSWYYASQAEQEDTLAQLEARSAALLARFEDYLGAQAQLLRLLRGLYVQGLGSEDESAVRVLVEEVIRREPGHVALRHLGRVRRLSGAELPGFLAQRRARVPVWEGLQARDAQGQPVTPGEQHDLADHIWPADEAPLILGLDLATIPACREAFAQALATDDVAMSRPFDMIRPEAGGPRPGLMLAVPLYDPARAQRNPTQREAALLGFAICVYDLEHLLRVGFSREVGADEKEPLVIEVSNAVGERLATVGRLIAPGGAARTGLLYLFGGNWVVTMRQSQPPRITLTEFLERPSTLLPAAVFTVMLLAAAIVWTLMRQTAVITEQVASQTSELREKNLTLERKETELNDANRRLLEMSHTDPLTGILNRRAFEVQLDKERERSLRTGLPFGLLLFDVDFFKGYNDRYGHVAGDEVLRRVAQIIQGEARRIDAVARYGGEEFVVLATATDSHGLLALAERIRTRIQEAGVENLASPFGVITISGGGSLMSPRTEGGPRQVIELSDRCLYQAKSTGRNRVVMVS